MNRRSSNNPTKVCIVCGKEYPVSRRKREEKRKFCSHKCRGKHFSGSMNGNWLGDKAKNRDHNERQRIICSDEYLSWRRAVLNRDDWHCQCCGSKKNLVVHHIVCYWDYPDERFEMENGVTVCRSCHTNIHLNKILFVRESSETNTLGFFIKTKNMIESELVRNHKRQSSDASPPL